MYVVEFANLMSTMNKLDVDQLMLYGVVLYQGLGLMWKVALWRMNCKTRKKEVPFVKLKNVAVEKPHEHVIASE